MKNWPTCDLIERIQNTLADHGLPVTALELEITERAAMAYISDSIKKLQQLQDLGIEVAIDDFGAEHSSLNYLKKLPASHFKIDRSFIKDTTSYSITNPYCIALS